MPSAFWPLRVFGELLPGVGGAGGDQMSLSMSMKAISLEPIPVHCGYLAPQPGCLFCCQYHLDKRQYADRVERHDPHLCRLRLGGSSAARWGFGAWAGTHVVLLHGVFLLLGGGSGGVGLEDGVKDEGG